MATIRAFYKYLLVENYIKINPTIGVKTPKLPQKLPKALKNR